jgi:hypothetical protein
VRNLFDLVEWAIALHGMYESSQVCFVSIENSIGMSKGHALEFLVKLGILMVMGKWLC